MPTAKAAELTSLKPQMPTETWSPTDEEKELVLFVRDRLIQMDDAKKFFDLEGIWDRADAMVKPGEATRASDLHIENPSTVKNSLVRTAVMSILAMTVARNNEMQYIADQEEDQKIAPVLQALSDFVSYVAKEKITKVRNYWNTIILGTGIRKRVYRCDTRTIRDIVSFDPETEELKFEEKTIKDFSDADLVNVDPRLFFVDPRSTSMDDAVDAAERKIITFESLKYEYPESKFPNVKFVLPGSFFKSTEDESRAEPVFAKNLGEHDVEIIEYWNKQRDMRLFIANGVILNRKDSRVIPYKHKQLPYTRSIFQLRNSNSFWGVGLPELLEHDQALLDTFLNLLIDWAKLSIVKPVLRGSGEDQTEEQMTLEAGKIMDVIDVNNYKFLDIPPVDLGAFQMLEKIEQNAKKKIGVDDPLFGVKSGGTATENAIAAQAARDKLDLFFKMLEEDVDVRDEWLKISVIQQFYSQPERVEEIVDEAGEPILDEQGQQAMQPVYRKLPIGVKEKKDEFDDQMYENDSKAYFEITPEAVGVYENRWAQFNVKVVSRSSLPISKELRQKKWNETLQTISAIPEFVQLADWKKLWQKTGEYAEFDAEGMMRETDPAQQMIELAVKENERMMKGEAIPPTQGATPEHSDRHRAFITSTSFDQAEPEIQQIFVRHYEGEILEQRKGEMAQVNEEAGMLAAGPMMPASGMPPAQAPASREEMTGQPAPEMAQDIAGAMQL